MENFLTDPQSLRDIDWMIEQFGRQLYQRQIEEEEKEYPIWYKILKGVKDEIDNFKMKMAINNAKSIMHLRNLQEKMEEQENAWKKNILKKIIFPQENQEYWEQKYFSEPKVYSDKDLQLKQLFDIIEMGIGIGGMGAGIGGIINFLSPKMRLKDIPDLVTKQKKWNILNEMLGRGNVTKEPTQSIKGLTEKLAKSTDEEEKNLIKALIEKLQKKK